MTSPLLTVFVLVVLWLIVAVPMVVRRKDERAGARSVARFAGAMRALASRRTAADPDDAPKVMGRAAPSAPQVSVPMSGPRVASRRPVPAMRESVMYPPDRSEMSEARQQMMARRRRSLTILGAGSGVFVLAALIVGGPVFWTLGLLFVAGLGGYLWFLRSQALRDKERRENRLRRAQSQRSARGYEVTARREPTAVAAPGRAEVPESVVRIDDEDVQLGHLDTVDLTGLYDGQADQPMRRAS